MRTSGNRGAAGRSGAEMSAPPGVPSDDTIERVLLELQQCGLLDDRRAADGLVRSRSDRMGQRALQRLLEQRAFEEEAIRAAIDGVVSSEFDRALSLWRNRFGQVASDPAERSRQFRFLLRRGFEADLIERVIRGKLSD